MGKYQRTKGRRGEQEIVNYWKDLFPSARRNLEFQKEVAEDGVDVVLDKYHKVQSKIGNQVPKKVYNYIDQMKETTGELHFVQMKRDNQRWLVLLDADDFKELIAMLKANNIIK